MLYNSFDEPLIKERCDSMKMGKMLLIITTAHCMYLKILVGDKVDD